MIDLSRYSSYGYDQRLEVFGPLGMLSVDNATPNKSVHSNVNGEHRYCDWSRFNKSIYF